MTYWSRPTSEVERIAHGPESFFLFLEVAVAELFKAAPGAVVFEELVYFGQQFGVPFSDADGPGFLLKRFQDGASGVGIFLPVLVGGHLVVDERVGFGLDDFEDAGGFHVEDEDLGVAQVFAGVEVASGALLDSDGFAGLIKIGDGLDRGVFADEQAEAGFQVGLGEINGLGALGRRGHGGEDEIDLAGLQRGDEPIKGGVLNFDFFAKVLGEGLGEVDADAGGLALLVGHFEGGIGEFHADDEFVVGGFLAGGEEEEWEQTE